MSADRKTNQEISLPKYENNKSRENVVLPSYLYLVKGRYRFDQGQVIEGGVGEYDVVWDFGTSRDSLRLEVPEAERITVNRRCDVKFLGFEDPSIRANMASITEIANDPSKTFKDPTDRDEYRSHLGKVYKRLAGEVRKKLGGEKALFFTPKNGGIYVRDIFTQEGFSSDDFYDYRMSRVLATDKDGKKHLNVAAEFARENPEISDYRTFVFADDCLASDISCFATLEHTTSQLKEKGIDPSGARVIISVSAATQRGLESLLSKEIQEYLGFGNMEVIATIPVYRLTDEFYLQEPDGRYTVGDMGRWTIKKI